MNRTQKLGYFSTILLIIGICGSALYGISSKLFIIPEKNTKIYSLEQKIEIFSQHNEALQKEINNMKMQIRWSNFLSIMLDEDSKVRFDHLEEYLTKGENGLYKPFEGGCGE